MGSCRAGPARPKFQVYSELYGGGGFDFWGPKADGEEREQETEEGKRGKEKGEEMFFWLAMYSITTFSLSAPRCLCANTLLAGWQDR